MATETEWSCPICRDARDDVSYAMPCCHQFCLGCILRWTDVKPDCPLCRRRVECVRFSVLGEDNYLQCFVAHPEESPDASSQAGSAPSPLPENSPHHPAASPPSSPQGIPSPAELEAAELEDVGGLLPAVWAYLFQRRRHLLDPVLPWLQQELEAIFGPLWWEARTVESSILHALCVHGPDEEVMLQMLEPLLGYYTPSVVYGIMGIIERQCSEEAWRLLCPHGAGEEDNSPAASSRSASSSSASSRSTSPSCSGSREGTPTAHPSSSSSPSGAEQEQPQEEPGQEAAAGHSAPGRGRDCSPGGSRRPAKRKGADPQDSPRPCKRPPRRRH